MNNCLDIVSNAKQVGGAEYSLLGKDLHNNAFLEKRTVKSKSLVFTSFTADMTLVLFILPHTYVSIHE